MRPATKTKDPPDSSRTIAIATFAHAEDRHPRRAYVTWDALVARLKDHDEREMKDGPAWSPALYRDGATRGREGVEAITAFVADIDHDGQARYEQLNKRLADYNYVIYSTHSHTLEDMRYRVVIELARPIPADDWPNLWQRANYWLFDNGLDPNTKDISRLYYFPSHKPGEPHFAWAHAGQPCDLFALNDAPTTLTNGFHKAETVPEKVTVGLRHYFLVSLAGTMRRRGLDAEAIEVLLKHVNATQCVVPHSEKHVRYIAESVAKYAPSDPIIGSIHFQIPEEEGDDSEEVRKPSVLAAINVPDLPECAQLDDDRARFAGGWLDLYLAQAKAISPMTPPIFHESAALVLASGAIARRIVVSTPFGMIFPNIWAAWIAPTTLWHKTTGLNYGRGVALRCFPHLLAPNEWTPESLLSDLSGTMPKNFDDFSQAARNDWTKERNFCAQRMMMQDEMSGLLASAGKDYNQGMIETLMQLYDCNPDYRRSTRGQGRLIILNSYLSFIGASTPRALAAHLIEERLWAMGWWPRFALLSPESDRPEWKEPTEREEPASIVGDLTRLYERLPMPTYPTPAQAVKATLGEGVTDAWQRYSKALSYDLLTDELDRRLWGTYGRMPVHALKVATILAALDWESGEAPTVELPHLARAIQITEGWRASAHRTLASATISEFDQMSARILRQVGRAEPDGITFRDLCRGMRDKKPDDIEQAVKQMLTTGDIESMGLVSSGGRPAERYRIARS